MSRTYHTLTSTDVDRILRALLQIADPGVREGFITALEETARQQSKLGLDQDLMESQ